MPFALLKIEYHIRMKNESGVSNQREKYRPGLNAKGTLAALSNDESGAQVAARYED
jgi:hypothetical protein